MTIHGLRDVDLFGRLGDSLGSLHGSVNGIRGGMDVVFAGLGDIAGWNGMVAGIGYNYGGYGTGVNIEDSSGIAHIVNAGMILLSLWFGWCF